MVRTRSVFARRLTAAFVALALAGLTTAARRVRQQHRAIPDVGAEGQ